MERKAKSKFYNEMMSAKLEREVEHVYKKGINKYYPDIPITNPYGSDGFISCKNKENVKNLQLLMEFKFEEKFENDTNISKVLIQVLYYLKKFENDAKRQPDVILVGDKYHVFILHFNDIKDYLDEDINWNIAPSKAGEANPKLVLKITKDEKISPYLYKINERFSFKTVADHINELSNNIQRKVRITVYNIEGIYEYFITTILKDFSKISPNDLVNIFISMIINPEEAFPHPNKKNVLIVNNKEVEVNSSRLNSFLNHFERYYKPSEREKFTEIADRLIEDTNRRFKGEYYTPTIWVNHAHDILSKRLGDNWKQDYVIWDCAWGTGNLTRDFDFENLYCSTLNDTDLEMGYKYNEGAVKFQYDFLNDDIDLLKGKTLLEDDYKIPKSLLEHFKNDRKILFLINPPYATAGNGKSKDTKSKDGTGMTGINDIMKEHKIGGCSQQLYAQFLYRILLMKRIFKLSNIKIGIFSPSLYMSGPSFKGFRKEFLKEFQFEEGMLFNASHFSDVKASWAIDFALWTNGESNDKENFIHTIKDISEDGEIFDIDKKIVYNLDESLKCSDWIKTPKAEQEKKIITLKSAINISNKVTTADKNSLGFLINDSNNIYANTQGVYIMSSKITRHIKTTTILPENFEDCMSLFTARNIIKENWINQKDEYLIPNKSHKKYKQWELDAVIYALFNTSSNQASLRKIEFEGNLFNVKNELFFMSNKEIRDLADLTENNEIYRDTKNFSGERFVYKYLKDKKLSNEASDVLDKAKQLIKKTFEYREILNNENPEYHLNTWDASWYQVKLILKKYYKNDLEEFNRLYSKLEEKLKPMVYELGFLR
ncbi:hypothetical protein ACV3R5_16320 [Clostridium perfringens]